MVSCLASHGFNHTMSNLRAIEHLWGYLFTYADFEHTLLEYCDSSWADDFGGTRAATGLSLCCGPWLFKSFSHASYYASSQEAEMECLMLLQRRGIMAARFDITVQLLWKVYFVLPRLKP